MATTQLEIHPLNMVWPHPLSTVRLPTLTALSIEPRPRFTTPSKWHVGVNKTTENKGSGVGAKFWPWGYYTEYKKKVQNVQSLHDWKSTLNFLSEFSNLDINQINVTLPTAMRQKWTNRAKRKKCKSVLQFEPGKCKNFVSMLINFFFYEW